MFHVDQCVRSRSLGLGFVVGSGENPRVMFRIGGERLVDGNTLEVVPDEVYDAEVYNCDEIERWGLWRVSGYANGEPYRLPKLEAEPPEVIEADEGLDAVRRVKAPERARYFIPEPPKGLRHRPRNWYGESPKPIPAVPPENDV